MVLKRRRCWMQRLCERIGRQLQERQLFSRIIYSQFCEIGANLRDLIPSYRTIFEWGLSVSRLPLWKDCSNTTENNDPVSCGCDDEFVVRGNQ